MHLIREQASEKGKVVVTTKCGVKVGKEDASIWWTDVDCTECVPYRFVPADDGIGLQMKDVRNTRVLRRRSTTPPVVTPGTRIIRRRG